jgi:DNA primase
MNDRSDLDNLKARVDLAEIIRQSGVELKQVGKNLMGRCPYHDDSTASLSVNGLLWNCFGCQAGGDVLEWFRLKEKIEFPEALTKLRNLVEPPDLLAGQFKRNELLERVVDHYVRRFRETPAAQQYLNKRGLDLRELWDAFRIGYCDGTLSLPESGPVRDALTEIGVLNSKGKEAFRGCIVVPLSHPEQGLVGLYGRRLSEEAKVSHQYLSGPHRGVLNWQGLQTASSIVIAESVLDALSLWRAGIREATCIYGVQGLPKDFEHLLSNAGVREVTFCLDGDKPGREATHRYSQQLSKCGLRCQSVDVPEGKDPNLLLQERGAEALRQLCRIRQDVAIEKPNEPPQISCELSAVQPRRARLAPVGQNSKAART